LTIAGCYLTPEGVVLGADSTSSLPGDGGMHYFDFNQKIFEIGESSTLALMTWGLGGLNPTSYRTLIALLGDDLAANPPVSLADVAQRWTDHFWTAYSNYRWVQECGLLHGKQKHDPAAAPSQGMRTADEEVSYDTLRTGLIVGFCVAGYVLPSRQPQITTITFDPTAGKPSPQVVTTPGWRWFGIPNIINRLIFGADGNLRAAILGSGKWGGTPQELDDLIVQQELTHGVLPVRDAIDYIHSCIHCTIKAMKFSNMPQVCGGPIELAVITTDRRFRWVRHKSFDAAIIDGAL
jgi:hypothetical protein